MLNEILQSIDYLLNNNRKITMYFIIILLIEFLMIKFHADFYLEIFIYFISPLSLMMILVLLFKNKVNIKYNHESYDENKSIKLKTIGEMIVINGFLIFLFNCYEGIEFMINNGVHEGSHNNVEAHSENTGHNMEIHSE